MGIQFSLTEAFTDTTLPILADDSLLAAGSLFLMDPAHSLGGFTGVPANGAQIPNIAWKQANQLVAGTPGQSALSGFFNLSHPNGSAGFPLVERSSKGGLHVVRSQANDIIGNYSSLQAPSAITAYLIANPNHAYYMSFWHRVTRVFTTGGSPYPGFAILGVNTSVYIIQGTPKADGTSVFDSANLLGKAVLGTSGLSTGIGFQAEGVSAHTGTPQSANFVAVPYIFGGTGGPYNGYHVGGSQILYRSYIEDLTVSAAALGITVAQRYAQVVAADQALYTAAFANGGKFYNDTFTAPPA